jgi:hypothetical protein
VAVVQDRRGMDGDLLGIISTQLSFSISIEVTLSQRGPCAFAGPTFAESEIAVAFISHIAMLLLLSRKLRLKRIMPRRARWQRQVLHGARGEVSFSRCSLRVRPTSEASNGPPICLDRLLGNILWSIEGYTILPRLSAKSCC